LFEKVLSFVWLNRELQTHRSTFWEKITKNRHFSRVFPGFMGKIRARFLQGTNKKKPAETLRREDKRRN